jgi:hypothetical protein
MKIVGLFLIFGNFKERYPFWAENSVNSFKKWHPDIDVIVDDGFKNDWILYYFKTIRSLFEKGYDKVICLNADTISCARFDELLADPSDIVGALDFPMDPAGYPYNIHTYIFQHNHVECKNINAGVLCFNNLNVINDLIQLSHDKPELKHEQGVIQYFMDIHPDKVKVIDFPYVFSRFVYNTRGLGTIGTGCMRDGKLYFGFDGPCIGDVIPMSIWSVRNNRLYNHLGKYVKMIHLANDYKDPNLKEWFNAETIEFFETHCACDWSLKT